MSHPHVAGSETSRAAAEAWTEDLDANAKGRIMRLLARFTIGLSDEDISDALGMNPSTQRPRRVELQAAGLVEPVGEKTTRAGRRCVTYRLTDQGRLLVAQKG